MFFGIALILQKKGWRSLEDCTTANDIVWQALYDISTILHPLFSENNSVDIVKAFGDQSRFEYAKTEGPQTRKDAKLMAQRTDFYQNTEINIEPHISSKTGDPSSPRFIRVYFAWDKPSNKIVIGQCGNHMPNHTSRTIH